MFKTVPKLAIAAAAVLALPGMAQAGTNTTTGTAALNVANQCAVTGANVNLGTYKSNQTWGDVSTALGYATTFAIVPGTQGVSYVNWGSVTCDTGIPYTLSIASTTGFSGRIVLNLNGKTAAMLPWINKIGNTTLADVGTFVPGTGLGQVAVSGVSGTGTGTRQDVIGSVYLRYEVAYANVVSTDVLGAAGTASNSLTYTLTF